MHALIGKPPPSPLPRQIRIRREAVRDRAQRAASATETGPDLVGDEQRAGGVRESAELGHERRGRHHAAAAPQDRLDEHRADVATRELETHPLERGVHGVVVRRIVDERDVRVELRRERLAIARA